jgi:hypothetical protein
MQASKPDETPASPDRNKGSCSVRCVGRKDARATQSILASRAAARISPYWLTRFLARWSQNLSSSFLSFAGRRLRRQRPRRAGKMCVLPAVRRAAAVVDRCWSPFYSLPTRRCSTLGVEDAVSRTQTCLLLVARTFESAQIFCGYHRQGAGYPFLQDRKVT